MSSNPEREEALFQAATHLPDAARDAYLASACGSDTGLRGRLDARLAERADEELMRPTQVDTSSPPPMVVAVPKSAARTEKPAKPWESGGRDSDFYTPEQLSSLDKAHGVTIGPYKLREKLGEGGNGVVYVAEQTEPVRRRVALKVIKLGMDTQQVVARFEAERQALAMMDHPNIAKVLDAGTTENGRPYFVMELVRGIRITDFCDQAQLSINDRLKLFIKVCHAIQHAHQKGIIHRDIKPGNVLVTLHDGVPVPKVIDFGIAKATEGRLTDEVYTQLHQFIGTPAYMSPEQAEMTGLDIDTRSDIYSLGVLLFEILTGSTPFSGKELMESGFDAMRKTIREKESPRPSTRLKTLQGEDLTMTARRRGAEAPKLVHLLAGDLDWIVMKCLEKDRTRRYDTANGLAADIQRNLDNEPVVARPPSSLYRLQKSFRRNRLFFSAVGAVAVALVIGLVLSISQMIRASRAEAEQKKLRAAAESSAAKARAETKKATQVASLLEDVFRSAGPSAAKGSDTKLLVELLKDAERRLETNVVSTDAWEVEESLRQIFGRTYRDLGDYEASLRNSRRALEISQKFRKAPNYKALSELAKALSLKGESAEAERLLREVLAQVEPRGSSTNLDYANALNDQGIILLKGGKPRDASEYFQKALAIKERVLERPNQGLADAHLNQSLLLIELGSFAQGEEQARLALSEYRSLQPERNPYVGMALHNQTKALRGLGRIADAEQAVGEAIKTYRLVYPGDHEYTAEALDDLGRVLQDKADLAGSEQNYRESLAMSKRLLGDDHPQALLTMRRLALLKAREPADPEADALMQTAVQLTRQRFSKKPVLLAACLSDQGTYLMLTGRLAQAEPVLLEAFQELAEAARPAAERKQSAIQLGQLYTKLDRPTDAAKWAEKAAAIANE